MMIQIIENSTLPRLEVRFAYPRGEDELFGEDSVAADSSISYYYAIPALGFAVVIMLVALLCMKRGSVTIIGMQQPHVDAEFENIEPEWHNNMAYENGTQTPVRTRTTQTSNGDETAQTPAFSDTEKALPIVSPQYSKIRPVGMATRIPQVNITKASKTSVLSEILPSPVSSLSESISAPLRRYAPTPQAELMKDIRQYQKNLNVDTLHTMATDLEDQSISQHDYWSRRATLDDSPTFQRLKYGSSRKSRDKPRMYSPSNLINPNVVAAEDKKRNGEYYEDSKVQLSRYKTLHNDFIYDLTQDVGSSSKEQSGYGYNTIDIGVSRNRRRGPTSREAETAWAIENHLTDEKPKLKLRLPSRRHTESSSFKRTYANSSTSMEDLPAELRSSSGTMESTFERHSSTSSNFSPYKLQIQRSIRPGKKILYRNGTRKRSNRLKRKISKRLSKNFEMGIVEESPSFYMGFDIPLPPAADEKLETTRPPSRPKLTLGAQNSTGNNDDYEEIRACSEGSASIPKDEMQIMPSNLFENDSVHDQKTEITPEKSKRNTSESDGVKLVLALTLSQRRKRGHDLHGESSADSKEKTEVVIGRIIDGYLVPDQPEQNSIYFDFRMKKVNEAEKSESVFVRTERLHTGGTKKLNKRRMKSKTLNDFISERHNNTSQYHADEAKQTEQQNNTTKDRVDPVELFTTITKLPSNAKAVKSGRVENLYEETPTKKRGLFDLRGKKKAEKEAKRLELKKSIEVVRKHEAKENPYWTIPSV